MLNTNDLKKRFPEGTCVRFTTHHTWHYFDLYNLEAISQGLKNRRLMSDFMIEVKFTQMSKAIFKMKYNQEMSYDVVHAGEDEIEPI